MNATTPPAADRFAVGLAIETTGQSGSVAVLRAGNVIRQVTLSATPRTAATLAPTLAETLQWCQEHGCKPDFIAVAAGPGSFTGLRIGVTTAKTLSYALNLPLVAVDSVAAVAATVLTQPPVPEQQPRLEQQPVSGQDSGRERDDAATGAAEASVLVGLNAYRGQVFTGTFRRTSLLESPHVPRPTEGETETPTRIVDTQQWQLLLSQLPRGAAVSGDPAVFRGTSGLRFLERTMADAVGVGLIALPLAVSGKWSDPMALVPRYLKPSAAEEKASARGSAER